MFIRTLSSWMMFDKVGQYEYDVREICTALNRIIRFAGHSNRSVLQHSYDAYRSAQQYNENPLVQFAVLVHDFHEAYTGDISGPVVAWLTRECGGAVHDKLAQLKHRIDAAMLAQFGWPASIYSSSVVQQVKLYDSLHLWQEAIKSFYHEPFDGITVEAFIEVYEAALRRACEYMKERERDQLQSTG